MTCAQKENTLREEEDGDALKYLVYSYCKKHSVDQPKKRFSLENIKRSVAARKSIVVGGDANKGGGLGDFDENGHGHNANDDDVVQSDENVGCGGDDEGAVVGAVNGTEVRSEKNIDLIAANGTENLAAGRNGIGNVGAGENGIGNVGGGENGIGGDVRAGKQATEQPTEKRRGATRCGAGE